MMMPFLYYSRGHLSRTGDQNVFVPKRIRTPNLVPVAPLLCVQSDESGAEEHNTAANDIFYFISKIISIVPRIHKTTTMAYLPPLLFPPRNLPIT